MEFPYLLLPVMVYHASEGKPVNLVDAVVVLSNARWVYYRR